MPKVDEQLNCFVRMRDHRFSSEPETETEIRRRRRRSFCRVSRRRDKEVA